MRLVEFVADDQATLNEVLEGPVWGRLEARLQEFVVNYRRKIVRLRDDQFQF